MLTLTGSSSAGRRFVVVRPADEKADEVLPVLFVWHWLKASPESAIDVLELEAATTQFRFVAVVPESKHDSPWDWPFDILSSDARLDEEARFFDDMLSCVAAQIPNVALHCVSSVGISAGALFTTQLATRRSERLSSVVSLSGGIGGVVRELAPDLVHRLPFFVLWGGPTDGYAPLLDFASASERLLERLTGQAVVECIHDCGHAAPPFDTPLRGAPVFRFAMDHPYGLPVGASPYAASLPKEFPSWCAFGAGKAVPRSGGECPTLSP
jgi:pimeloyl-ACP methyl ester carboxylesterase